MSMEKTYCGMKFSILGDSISTLEGYNPDGFKVYYTGRKCRKTNVRKINDTWWGNVIDFFGGSLLVNNSWSGSRVTKEPGRCNLFPSGCSDERTGGLHTDEYLPDVIIIFLGANDWEQGALINEDNLNEATGTKEETFEYAYRLMLKKIRRNYPESEIWCCTLGRAYISRRKRYKFTYTYSGAHIDEYNRIIRDVSNEQSCRIIDFAGWDSAYDSIDGSHPTLEGMRLLSEIVIHEIIS